MIYTWLVKNQTGKTWASQLFTDKMYGLELKTSCVAYGALGIFRVVAAGTVKYHETEFYDISVWWVYWALKSFLPAEINVVNINLAEYSLVFQFFNGQLAS